MLYDHATGVNAAPHPNPGEDSSFNKRVPPNKRDRRGYPVDVVSMAGLAATVPHRANVQGTSSGGGYYPADAGGGGAGGASSNPIAVTTPPSARLGPAGRNTSPFEASQGRAIAPRRVKYQATAQGPRVSRGEAASPLTPHTGNAYPTGGLFGLGGFFDDAGSFLKRAVTPPKSTANILKVAAIPFTAGLSLLAPSRMFTPPAAINRPLQDAINKGIRPAIRYAGATTQSILFPVLTGGQQRSMFGLNAGESGVFMKAQQVFRAIDAAVITAGAAYYMSPAYAYAGATPYTEAAYGASPGYTQAGIPVGNAAASLGPKAYGLNLVQTTAPSFANPSPFSTPMQLAANGGASSGSGIGSIAATGAKFIGKGVAETLLPIVAMKVLAGGGAPNGSAPGGGVYVSAGQPDPQAAQGGYAASPAFGASGSGGYGGDSAPIEAGMSPVMMLVLGGALVSAGYVFLKGKL